MKRLGLSVVLALVASIAGMPVAAQADATAPGAPGAQSYFDLARKDCVGTARNTTSKVWFTVAGGVLSDVYWPTVDATNVHTLQYVVSDGHSFTDLQTRDMTYTSAPDPSGMACTVLARSAAHGYRITTTYIADPRRDAVLMHVRFDGPRSDKLYVRLDPLAGGTGGGGADNAGGNTAQLVSTNRTDGPVPVASNTNTVTNASNRDYAVPTFEALRSSSGFDAASVGYAGTPSDGQQMLDSDRTLSTTYTSAPNGHVALTAQLRLPRNKKADLALGFGTDQTQAIHTAGAGVRHSFGRAFARYERQWWRYDRALRRPTGAVGRDAQAQYYRSVNVVKASEDKTFPGAIAAGLASPWGQSVPAGNATGGKPTYFGSYREVFARDLYEAFAGLLVAGDLNTARAATRFLFERQQQPDGSMPRNSLTNGKPAPDTGGLQLDETSYPILMAWQSGLAHDAGLYQNHIVPAADFLVAHGPSDGVERWEEQSGYSPSTIAAEIAGLTAAAQIARTNHDATRAGVYQAAADDFARTIKQWTVTTSGPYAPSYFLRLSKTGDPNAAISYALGNGSITADQRSIVDAGFLELVRLGILPASDSTVRGSLPVIDQIIRRATPTGDGFYRYGTSDAGSEDGYGDCYEPDPTNCSPTGAPWPPTGRGSGHLWPVLAGERGEYQVASGSSSSANALLRAMSAMTSGGYLEPEQAWEDPALPASPFGSDPATASIGFSPGHPAGSASPLTWAQSQFARLALAVGARRNLETPGIVSDRYVAHGMPGALPLTISSPADGSSVSGSTVTVTGTTTAGARVDAEATPATGGAAGTGTTMADGGGHWSLQLPTSFGTTKITVASTLGNSTGYAQVSVINVTLPGQPPVLNLTDPSGDDNGPGTYAYPTSGDFQPGAFDLLGFQVTQTATDVYIQAKIRNLAPTFGNSFGAQLLDIYVRNPAAGTTSTAAPFPQHNYAIAPADAWSERIEVQAFAAPVWVDAAGNSLGSLQTVFDRTSGTATLILPKSSFGSPGSGWTFTVALTGQDGFSPDQARGFAPTPQPFQFGVCVPGGTSPICAVDPATVPKVLDTITPSGVSQDTELDPTRGPVTLSGVRVP
ncbi:MAG: glucodextranase DOMON-like domain-containing protein [Solirubrobacteraceae bacterium]